jgi:thymidine phosphorylase
LTVLPQEIIRKKRDGQMLSRQEISQLVDGLSRGSLSDSQAAAFAMAVFFRGMTESECVALTTAMRDSGTVLSWPRSDFPGPVVDKHSTGGIGDNVSLMLAPMLAATGAYVPMISGRALGHTGGTLDKLESIPGYATAPDLARFRQTVKSAGCAIIGQTDELAPADRRLYAIRDITATVESIPLITASILSKKLAAGLDSLVLDVKLGSGAFMKTIAEARELAGALVGVGKGAGLNISALITDMDEPLAPTAGNALEVMNAVSYLKGDRQSRLNEIVLALGEELLFLSHVAPSSQNARKMLDAAIATGKAAEHFARMVAILGGPHDFIDQPEAYLPVAPILRPVAAREQGTVASIDTRLLGLSVIVLGGGRSTPDQPIDNAVGLSDLAPRGAELSRGEPLAMLHARDPSSAETAEQMVLAAYRLGAATEAGPVIRERIG